MHRIASVTLCIVSQKRGVMGTIRLYRHQEVALALMRAEDDFALFMEQGTGKTIPTLIRAGELLMKGKAHSALVVCPKAVIGSWQRDIEKLSDDPSNAKLKDITVVNYDVVWRRKEYLNGKWDILILDESHKIKRHTTRRGRALLQMSLKAKYRYILTGTPINNGHLENIWSQFCFLEPYEHRGYVYSKIFGGSYYKWLDDYAFLDKYHQPYRYHDVDKLQRIIEEHSYRVTKEECLDLPDKLPDEVYDIECLEKKRYRELMRDSTLEEFDVVATNPLSRMTKLRQLCSGRVVDPYTGEHLTVKCEKENALREFLDGWEKKLVIFCQFTDSIDAVCGVLDGEKVRYAVLDGRTKDKSVWKRFQTEASLQVIVCQYESANAGIDLYAADTMLFYEPTLSSNTLEQAKDRIHRIGQTSKCSYIHFITTGTIERAIYHALSGYRDFSKQLFEEYIGEYQRVYRN